ncbi:CBL-interacting serine/threonine-protein kinase 7 [Hibiscus syriacus]|uniref:CBL-interacting serine/threonine-protein kinase 7 n=1 Tax=Hibiscus syriacus TaxID=106335 RepID=A0A6A3AJK8_HIBSY|nr:CBL-interacting serine/threonine-protein kinase 7 [Hibiscus syriacus]
MRHLQHHPNILKIHEVMATKTKIYLVMEFASGGKLFTKVLRRGKLTETTSRRYFTQLVSAFHFCHQNGVAHRDVKPQNLLLDKNGNLKVSDFGLSALPEQLNHGLLHTACGTPAFTLRRLFGGKGMTVPRLMLGLVGEFQFPPWISKQVKTIIWQLLDPNPDTRMSLLKLMETSWLKKSLTEYTSLNKVGDRLDLSGLFEGGKEKRYTTSMELEVLMERVKEAGERLGYTVEKEKRGVLGLGKGKVVLTVEAVEIAGLFVLVEVKVVEGTVEFEEGRWLDLEAGHGNIFVPWDNHVVG